MRIAIALATTALFVGGCTGQSVLGPTSPASGAAQLAAPTASAGGAVSVPQGKPGYEPAYYRDETVTINAIEVHQSSGPGPLRNAAADFYEVVYPTDHSLWPGDPQCNPCDHQGNGLDPTDYHDHVLDSIPSSPGHGEYNALWHVYVIVPVTGHEAAYAARLPMTSEGALDDAINAGDAEEIDAQFYFICAVVSPNAAKTH
jgi:hypothetical protein